MRKELEALNDQELKIAELETEVEQLTATCKKYAERQEEARIDQALEREQISSINIVQPPTLSDRPVSPRTVPLLAIGLFFATFGSVLVIITADYFDGSFSTSEQVERQLELPVLISIPHTSRKRLVELN